ncbi:MAG: tRNA 2-thiouridine(34) synthase MnmA [Candidatus Omnitrophota bacterium]
MKRKVAVGLSGGIDSSVAAFFLKEQGYEVTAFTLKFYPQENRCCDSESIYQAQRLCHKLNIPHYIIPAENLFKNKIVQYFIESYLKGLTPNPCTMCNRFIKFGFMHDEINNLNVDYLATGHYARIIKKGDNFFIAKAKDAVKSQDYFLSLVEPPVLKCLVFPLAEFTKAEVKSFAGKNKIIFHKRKESQDICFVEDMPYPAFIKGFIKEKAKYLGQIKHIRGAVLGEHKGIYNFTYGQRHGLGVSWKEPLYVVDIDSITNTVFAGERKYLKRKFFYVSLINLFSSLKDRKHLKVQIRYNSPLFDCSIKQQGDFCKVILDNEIEGVAPGQVAAFYHDDMILAAGIIEKSDIRK